MVVGTPHVVAAALQKVHIAELQLLYASNILVGDRRVEFVNALAKTVPVDARN